MKTSHMACLLVPLLLLAACKPQQAANPAASQPAKAEEPAVPAVDATSVVDNTDSAADAAGVDSKAIAGRFGDGESVLELRADGGYVQTLAAGGDSMSSDGTWSATGQTLLLDPNSKSAEDVSLAIVSNDELSMDGGKRTFRRVAAP